MADNNSGEILLNLKESFLEEKRDIQNSIIEIETQIQECKEYVVSLNKKDESDFSMFSPRSASRVYKDQVSEKKLEIEDLEEKLRIHYKKLSNVTKKIDSLNSLNADNLSLQSSDANDEKEQHSLFLKFQEDDRQRIAADLHDSVLQNLSLIMHNMELANKFIDYDPIRAKLEIETNRKLVKETIDEIRDTIFDLRPMQFDDFGFKITLENTLESYKSRTDMSLEYHIDNIDSSNHLILLTIFRIVQELVSNSIKHSEGENLLVQVLDESSKIYIEVFDDGMGISDNDFNKEDHFGFKILKERISAVGGTLFFPKVEKGLKVVIEIPV